MTKHRSATRSRAGVRSVAAAAVMVAVAGAGLAYQSVATAQERRRLSAPGRLVDAGGHELHLLITGEDQGGPTVVLEAGGMATAPMWALIQPGIAEFARVVSYDRAGLGWSEPGPTPRDARTIARELHTALRSAGVPGPYLLVGGSLGGPYTAVFADAYPDDTAGLVLVDSVHPDQLQRMPPQAQRALGALRVANRVLPMLARLGLTRLVDVTGVLLGGLPSKLPPQAADQLRVFAHWPGHWAAVYDEVSVWDDTMEQMRQAMHGVGRVGLPLTVITAPDNPGMEEMREPWLDMQRELAGFSSTASHVVLEGAGHISMATEPVPIQTVIQAVHDMLDLRRARPVS
ncbi:MAG: alpha/beta hydrolase [Micropruina sp.]|nr:alpha/beta hydrolase [Micropruina sp.]